MITSIILVSAAERDAANAAAHALGIDPLGLLTTLIAQSVPFPGDASVAATFYGCMGPLSSEQRTAALAQLSQFPNAKFWELENGKCVNSWNQQNLGDALDYDKCLALVGLQRREFKWMCAEVGKEPEPPQ